MKRMATYNGVNPGCVSIELSFYKCCVLKKIFLISLQRRTLNGSIPKARIYKYLKMLGH